MTGALVAALTLTITTPQADERISVEELSGRKIEVAGKVSGAEPLRVTVNGERAPIGSGGWRIDFRVQNGWNTLRVVATDGDGNKVRKERRFKVVSADDPGEPSPVKPTKSFTDQNDSRGKFDVRSGTSRIRSGKVIHKIVFWDRLRLRSMIGYRHGQISIHIGGGPGTGPPRWEILITGHNGYLQSLLVDHATGGQSRATFSVRRKTLKAKIPKSAISRDRYAWQVETGYVGGDACPTGTGNAPTHYKCDDTAGFGKVKLG